jgi:hypothetical protein
MSASFVGYTDNGDRIVRLGSEIYKEDYGCSTLTKLEDKTLEDEFCGYAEEVEAVPYFEPEFGFDLGLLED